jgi:acyl-CoA dehydrogenase
MRNAGDGRHLTDVMHRVGKEVAADHTNSVDRNARFPTESFDALKSEKLLSAYVPKEFGGMGLGIGEIADACFVLGQYCASTAMIYAMHQIQVACIVHHGQESDYFRDYLKTLVDQQLLIASATSEVGTGGDLRSSVCGIEVADGKFSLEKQAPVISYGEAADDILVTSRRAPDAPASDQVITLVRSGEYELDPFTTWDTLGFRGTCSIGFKVKATGAEEQIVPTPFADIASATMLPVSHLVWTSLWSGLATDAVNLAREFVRGAARKNPDQQSPAALRLAEVMSDLQMMRANVRTSVADYEQRLVDPDALGGFGFAIAMNNLKIASSQVVVSIVNQAMLVCGINGYKNDSKFSLSRHLRDAHGAALMINNDRILGANASMLLVHKDD